MRTGSSNQDSLSPVLPPSPCTAACSEEFPAHWVPPLSAPLWLSVPVLILSRTLK